jgi:hypothetical protein
MTGFNIDKIKQSKKRSEQGAWITCGGGLKILVCNMHECAPYKEHLLRKGKSIRRQIERDQIDLEATNKLAKEAVAHHILKDWNLTTGTGVDEKPIPFSPATALKIFDEAPEFYAIVVEEASNRENFRALSNEDLEADAGN